LAARNSFENGEITAAVTAELGAHHSIVTQQVDVVREAIATLADAPSRFDTHLRSSTSVLWSSANQQG
jgi:hypothetical protein